MPKKYAGGFIHKRFTTYNPRDIKFLDESAFSSSNDKLFLNFLYGICDETHNLRRQEMLRNKEFAPQIGIVTALPVELRAMKNVLGELRIDASREQNSPYQEYIHGEISSKHGGKHKVVVANAGKGNNKAAVLATTLMNRYPSVEEIFMVGVAAGVPYLEDPMQHVRLGDIVVCDENGVIQYDMVKRSTATTEYNPPPRPPDHSWLTRVDHYFAMMTNEPGYWQYLDEILSALKISRPHTAPLRDCPWIKEDSKAARQPDFPGRNPNRPRIHRGPIASANTVLKSASIRDRLKKKFRVKAVEMEASGIAEATWQHGKGYFVIRGICDYANDDKNKKWQPYAAAAAAAFTRELIEGMPLVSRPAVKD